MTPQKEQTRCSHKQGNAREGENLPSACVTQKRKGRARVANVAKIEKGRDRDKGAVRERIDDGDLRDPVDNEQHERCRKPLSIMKRWSVIWRNGASKFSRRRKN